VTYLLTVLHCVFLVLVPGLFLDNAFGVSASDFSVWRRSRSVVVVSLASESGELSNAQGRVFEKFCEYLSEDHAVDNSLTCRQRERAVCWVFSPVHCGERVLVISLAGQSAVWDS